MKITLRFILLLIIPLLFIAKINAQPTLIHNINGFTFVGQPGPKSELFSFDTLVFEDGKVLFIGELNDAKKKFSNAITINGNKKTLLPGLIDAHGHVLGLGQGLSTVDLRGTQSEQEAIERIIQYAKENPKQKWIIGRGWNQVLWPDKKFPSKKSLDQLKLNRPIFLSRIDGHAAWVNSKALAIAKINKQTKDPDGGQILRDSSGEATGVLIDTAEYLVSNKIPVPTQIEINFALDKAFNHLIKLGLTSVHDAGIKQPVYEIYQQRAEQNTLPLRIYAMLDGSSDNLSRWLENGIIKDKEDKLLIRSVKLYSDGALGSRGAALIKPYSDLPDHKGLLVTQPDILDNRVELVLKAGFQANIHAIGDRGNRIVLDALESALKQNFGTKLRHRIEHAQIVALSDLKRFKELNLIASMQPTHATSDMNMAEDRVGAERIKGAYAWRTLLDQGTIIASGSDFPVELANPFHGIHAAVTRQNHNNQPESGWKPEQKMTLKEALRSFTLDAAYAAHQEKEIGSLEPGKWADFIIVDQNPFNIPPENLWNIQVEQTWIAGQQVFEKAL
ncbi:amidohydrolase [Pleionea sediminis]|uniref:amidohydrolase n=1 Tax=Pleionea sediminis TaxID=2569479 RepID=UPI00118679CD|nr:amidohydrolase [Pleionea sediminis]